MPRKRTIEKHKGVYEKHPGTGIWWIRYTDAKGKRVTESIGRHGDAVTLYQQRMTEKRTGLLTPIGKSARGVKFSALVDDAIKHNKDNRKDNRNFAQRIEVARAHFGTRAADTITPQEIDEWLSGMVNLRFGTPLNNATRNRYKAAISKAYALGNRHGKVSTNPARFVEKKKESAGRVRFLSHNEETRLRKIITANRPHCLYQLDIALNTGMRKGEQFGVTWEQVDMERGFIHLEETKNGSSRYVHLNDTALASLKALQAARECKGMAFPTLFYDHRCQPIHDPREWFNLSCIEAKITGLTWHGLRHTFASRLVMAGVDLVSVKELMGHKTIAMTAKYSHLAPEHLKSAINMLGGKVQQSAAS
jgi:integrase